MTALGLVFFVCAPPLVLLLVIFSLRDDLKDNWRALVFLAAACALFFHRILFFGEALSQSDANLLQLKFFTVYRTAVLTYGEVPFWNAFEGAGVPNLAHPLSAMFYPLAPIFLFGGIFAAMNVFVVCHFFLGGGFALLLARRIFKTRAAAIAFAILYAFNGWAVMRTAHQPAIEYIFAYAWLPLAALAFERGLEGKVLSSIAAGGAALAWMGITCPNFFVYAVLVLAIAFVLRAAELIVRGRKNALLLGFAVAVGSLVFAFALGAPEYGPASELASLSTTGRLGVRNPADWRGRALSIWTMLRLYLPIVKARPFAVYYSPGALALAGALLGLWQAVVRGKHRDLALASLVMLFFGAAVVLKAAPYEILTRASDTFARSSLIPAGLILLFLPVVVLAAVGVDAVATSRHRLKVTLGYAAAGLIFAELFIGFGIVYPRYGTRRLTFDYRNETADFPHLDSVASQGEPGRILVISSEGHVLAPSYAALVRGLSRLNLHESAFPPDALESLIGRIEKAPRQEDLEALGVGWVVSAEPLEGLGVPVEVPWSEVSDHFENSVYFPMHNQPGWLAWDKVVRLYRVSERPAVVRGEPPTRASIITGESALPLEALEDQPLEEFGRWLPAPQVLRTANTLTAVLPRLSSTRYFLAVTDYPGWRLYVDGEEVRHAVAAGSFMALDASKGARRLEARFRPTHWRMGLSMAAAALLFCVVAAGSTRATVRARHTPPDR